MHEDRILALQERLIVLQDKMLAARTPLQLAIQADVDATQAELDSLTGIKDRNDALAAQAPDIARREQEAIDRRALVRGSGVSRRKGSLPDPNPPPPATP